MSSARVVLAAVVMVACNPHTSALPAALCREARYDCRPGESCEQGECRAPDVVRVIAASDGGPDWVAIVGTAPRQMPDLSSPWLRLLAPPTPPDEAGRATFERTPRLPRMVLAWRGRATGPCHGDPFVALPVPNTSEPVVALSLTDTWVASCFALPRALEYSDRFAFASAPRAAPPR